VKRVLIAVVFGLVGIATAAVAYAQPSMRHRGHMGHGASMIRHHFVHEHGIDARYAGKSSPLQPSSDDLAQGRALYATHCAACHGPAGAGDGEAGRALDPPPADVVAATRRPMATDAYLFWTIAAGGPPVGSAMPPFEAVLSEVQIWQVIAHLRAAE
jgi:mono/diheme cytochrome c family protein